ncbi:MAG TPA: hypothetical protein VHO50_06810 [Bacteroidales bacterium]|nr:hypothetical protein [Bacteroidales bacterium]
MNTQRIMLALFLLLAHSYVFFIELYRIESSDGNFVIANVLSDTQANIG